MNKMIRIIPDNKIGFHQNNIIILEILNLEYCENKTFDIVIRGVENGR